MLRKIVVAVVFVLSVGAVATPGLATADPPGMTHDCPTCMTHD